MLAEYVYLGDQLLAMIKPGQPEAVYYFHNDHLGTPHVLTDDTGTIAWKAVYAPFGYAVASIQTVDNPFRFPGQYYDQETGLHYNYFRYYNPQTGRYITPDPIGLEGGINLFSYVANNSINAVDPLGLLMYCSQLRVGNKTTITCYDPSGTHTYYLSEPAPIDPKAPYEKDQQLSPGIYFLLPRTTWGRVLPTGSPIYTTPGQQAGTIITPTRKKRGGIKPAGPHIAGPSKKSEGCPLFPDTKKGKKQKKEFYRHFKENINTGGTWIVILDDSKGGLINEY
jgi:RHS repeat-associated protein